MLKKPLKKSKRLLVTTILILLSLLAINSVYSQTYSGYLFAHFTGESTDGEQIYFAASTDGLHWTDCNNSQPVLISNVGEMGVRDPSLIRSADGSRFWLIATDLRIASGKGWDVAQHSGSTSLVIWESTDLVNWSQPRLANVAGAIPDAGCAWAPEAIYNEDTGNYVVYWATISPLDGIDKARIYYATTTDFRSFTSPQLYINRPDTQGIIDTQILKVENSTYRYYRASGDGQITFEGSNSILGYWTDLGNISHLGLTGSDVEGPILYKFNGQNNWGLMVDQYATGGGYLPLLSSDLSSTGNFRVLDSSEYSLGTSHKRHGGILNITAAELDRIRSQWPNDPVSRIQSYYDQTMYVRHYDFDARIDADVSPYEDSQWRIVPGLADANGYISFESVNYPGYFLRHYSYDLELAQNDDSSVFAEDATFGIVPGLADSGWSVSYTHLRAHET